MRCKKVSVTSKPQVPAEKWCEHGLQWEILQHNQKKDLSVIYNCQRPGLLICSNVLEATEEVDFRCLLGIPENSISGSNNLEIKTFYFLYKWDNKHFLLFVKQHKLICGVGEGKKKENLQIKKKN